MPKLKQLRDRLELYEKYQDLDTFHSIDAPSLFFIAPQEFQDDYRSEFGDWITFNCLQHICYKHGSYHNFKPLELGKLSKAYGRNFIVTAFILTIAKAELNQVKAPRSYFLTLIKAYFEKNTNFASSLNQLTRVKKWFIRLKVFVFLCGFIAMPSFASNCLVQIEKYYGIDHRLIMAISLARK